VSRTIAAPRARHESAGAFARKKNRWKTRADTWRDHRQTLKTHECRAIGQIAIVEIATAAIT
jgi:hypothetical protein